MAFKKVLSLDAEITVAWVAKTKKQAKITLPRSKAII